MSASNLFGKALESAPDAIVIADATGRILFANLRVLAVLGYDPAELLGQRYIHVTSSNFGRSGSSLSEVGDASQGGRSAGLTRSEDRRFYVEPTRFTTLKRGGADHGFTVESIVYNGGTVFAGAGGEAVPLKTISIRQR